MTIDFEKDLTSCNWEVSSIPMKTHKTQRGLTQMTCMTANDSSISPKQKNWNHQSKIIAQFWVFTVITDHHPHCLFSKEKCKNDNGKIKKAFYAKPKQLMSCRERQLKHWTALIKLQFKKKHFSGKPRRKAWEWRGLDQTNEESEELIMMLAPF